MIQPLYTDGKITQGCEWMVSCQCLTTVSDGRGGSKDEAFCNCTCGFSFVKVWRYYADGLLGRVRREELWVLVSQDYLAIDDPFRSPEVASAWRKITDAPEDAPWQEAWSALHYRQPREKCSECSGSGWISPTKDCKRCNGEGVCDLRQPIPEGIYQLIGPGITRDGVSSVPPCDGCPTPDTPEFFARPGFAVVGCPKCYPNPYGLDRPELRRIGDEELPWNPKDPIDRPDSLAIVCLLVQVDPDGLILGDPAALVSGDLTRLAVVRRDEG